LLETSKFCYILNRLWKNSIRALPCNACSTENCSFSWGIHFFVGPSSQLPAHYMTSQWTPSVTSINFQHHLPQLN